MSSVYVLRDGGGGTAETDMDGAGAGGFTGDETSGELRRNTWATKKHSTQAMGMKASVRENSLGEAIKAVCHMYTCIRPFPTTERQGDQVLCYCGKPVSDHELEPTNQPWQLGEFHVRKDHSHVFGTLRFVNGNASKMSVPYLRCGVQDDPKMVATIIRRMLRKSGTPNLILSVTGGARSFLLPEDTLVAIRKGLMHAAENTNAWLVTGGSNTGVMKLVGEVMASRLSGRRVPLLGIGTWGTFGFEKDVARMVSRKLTDRLDVDYASPPPPQNGLDSNHNFFLFVDSACNKFGGEINFRAQIESELAGNGTPIVLIVIQGGPGTIQTARDAVAKGTPLVTIAGSGAAADLLVFAWEFFHGTNHKTRTHTLVELRRRIRNTYPELIEPDLDRMLNMLIECVEDRHKCVVFNVHDSNVTLDRAILEAIVANKQGDPTKVLRQAIIWARLDVARDTLAEKSISRDAVNDNLMFALKNNSPEFVDLFLERGAQAWMLRPTGSTASPGWEVFLTAVDELYHDAAKNETGHVANLILKHQKVNLRERRHLFSVLDKHATVRNVEAILTRLVSRDLVIDRNIDEKVFQQMPPQEKNWLAFHVLMMWAVCLNKFRLAHSFWLRGVQSIPNALLASCILDRLAHDEALAVAHLADERLKLAKNSKKFEELAVGVLEECHHTDPKMTQQLLHQRSGLFGKRHCIEIAHLADNLRFLSNPATQTVVTNDWYYYIHTSTSSLAMLAGLLFPPWIFMINFNEKQVPVNSEEGMFGANDNKDDEDAQHNAVELKWYRKVYAFYHAPMTRFLADAICFTVLVGFHSYMALEAFTDTVRPYEIVLAVWFITILADELRQFFELGFRTWVEDIWNIIDATIIVVYFSGFITRAANPAKPMSQVSAKCIFAVSTILLFLRLTRFYAGSTVLGPKVLMVYRMFVDLAVFLCLLVLLMLGYGIAIQALLFPYREFDQYTVLNVIYKPYFHAFGELFLADLQQDADCVGGTFFTGCGFKAGWLVALMLAGYLLMSNLLLVNLLIAMFNRTYVEVQEQSMMLWNKQNFELLQEYRSRPFFPGPLVIIADIGRLFFWIFTTLQARLSGHNQLGLGLSDSSQQATKLIMFQETQTDKFVMKMTEEKRTSMESQVYRTLKQSDVTINLVKQLQEDNMALRSALERFTSHTTKHTTLELSSQFHQDDDWLPPLKYPATGAPPRLAIKMEQRPWTVAFVSYEGLAPDWTAEVVLKSAHTWADPADAGVIAKEFNTSDGRINRVSFSGAYILEPDTLRPVNPKGRTGLRGRGLLGKWGVNHAADTIVTRWKRTGNGIVTERDGKRVLEFICILRKEGGEWAIPGGFVDNGDTVKGTLQKEFEEEALNSEDMDIHERERVRSDLQSLFSHGQLVASVYCHDPRNTDNAWVETTAYNYHDETGHKTAKVRLSAGDDAAGVRWKTLHAGLRLYASHRALLEAVAKAKGAYW